jgi:hypothetical protein
MKGPAESGQICSVGRRKIAKTGSVDKTSISISYASACWAAKSPWARLPRLSRAAGDWLQYRQLFLFFKLIQSRQNYNYCTPLLLLSSGYCPSGAAQSSAFFVMARRAEVLRTSLIPQRGPAANAEAGPGQCLLAKARRCGARTRAGHPCRQAAVTGRARCRMHGGGAQIREIRALLRTTEPGTK